MKPSFSLLIDFDGVLKIDDLPAPGIKEFLDFIRKNNINSCLLSNSTLRTGELITEFFSSHNIDLQISAITAFDATVNFVKQRFTRTAVYCRDYLIHHFSEILDYTDPEAVVVGDIGENWNYKTMNEIFRFVYSGKELIAMHKNKFWKPEGEMVLDAGSFISAIEYASGTTATVIGKPSPHYFHLALESMGKKITDSFLMVGDDIENDIEGAQNAGGKGILIYTGKTPHPHSNKKIKPDFEVKSLIELTELLSTII